MAFVINLNIMKYSVHNLFSYHRNSTRWLLSPDTERWHAKTNCHNTYDYNPTNQLPKISVMHGSWKRKRWRFIVITKLLNHGLSQELHAKMIIYNSYVDVILTIIQKL